MPCVEEKMNQLQGCIREHIEWDIAHRTLIPAVNQPWFENWSTCINTYTTGQKSDGG
jgi:hypothetical protein